MRRAFETEAMTLLQCQVEWYSTHFGVLGTTPTLGSFGKIAQALDAKAQRRWRGEMPVSEMGLRIGSTVMGASFESSDRL